MNSAGDDALLSSFATFQKVSLADLLSLLYHITFCYSETHLCTCRIPKADFPDSVPGCSLGLV